MEMYTFCKPESCFPLYDFTVSKEAITKNLANPDMGERIFFPNIEECKAAMLKAPNSKDLYIYGTFEEDDSPTVFFALC